MAAPVSAARLNANRKNARLSTGPTSPEGKARSRTNAVKHGLTGAGIALPTEDAAAIEARFLEMQEQFAPQTLEGALLIRLAAFMSVRIDRCGQHETAALAMVQRHAATEFDLARLAEIDRLFDTIETNPREHHRRLQTTVEGIDRLLAALGGVRIHVESGYYKRWTTADRNKIDAFLGGSTTRFPTTRPDALMCALQGNLIHLAAAERDQLPEGEARDQYCRDQLLGLVAAEEARLGEIRATIDTSVVATDRLEAARRATLAPTPETILFKKYEAAAINTFLRTLRDFHKLENTEPEPEPEPEPASTQTATEPEVAAPNPVPVEPVAVAKPVAPALPTPVAPVVENKANPVVTNGAKPQPNPVNPNYHPSIRSHPTPQY